MSLGPSVPQTIYVSFIPEVVPATIEPLLGLLSQLANQGVPEVNLMLSTPGGQVMVSIAAYNVMRA